MDLRRALRAAGIPVAVNYQKYIEPIGLLFTLLDNEAEPGPLFPGNPEDRLLPRLTIELIANLIIDQLKITFTIRGRDDIYRSLLEKLQLTEDQAREPLEWIKILTGIQYNRFRVIARQLLDADYKIGLKKLFTRQKIFEWDTTKESILYLQVKQFLSPREEEALKYEPLEHAMELNREVQAQVYGDEQGGGTLVKKSNILYGGENYNTISDIYKAASQIKKSEGMLFADDDDDGLSIEKKWNIYMKKKYIMSDESQVGDDTRLEFFKSELHKYVNGKNQKILSNKSNQYLSFSIYLINLIRELNSLLAYYHLINNNILDFIKYLLIYLYNIDDKLIKMSQRSPNINKQLEDIMPDITKIFKEYIEKKKYKVTFEKFEDAFKYDHETNAIIKSFKSIKERKEEEKTELTKNVDLLIITYEELNNLDDELDSLLSKLEFLDSSSTTTINSYIDEYTKIKDKIQEKNTKIQNIISIFKENTFEIINSLLFMKFITRFKSLNSLKDFFLTYMKTLNSKLHKIYEWFCKKITVFIERLQKLFANKTIIITEKLNFSDLNTKLELLDKNTEKYKNKKKEIEDFSLFLEQPQTFKKVILYSQNVKKFLFMVYNFIHLFFSNLLLYENNKKSCKFFLEIMDSYEKNNGIIELYQDELNLISTKTHDFSSIINALEFTRSKQKYESVTKTVDDTLSKIKDNALTAGDKYKVDQFNFRLYLRNHIFKLFVLFLTNNMKVIHEYLNKITLFYKVLKTLLLNDIKQQVKTTINTIILMYCSKNKLDTLLQMISALKDIINKFKEQLKEYLNSTYNESKFKYLLTTTGVNIYDQITNVINFIYELCYNLFSFCNLDMLLFPKDNITSHGIYAYFLKQPSSSSPMTFQFILGKQDATSDDVAKPIEIGFSDFDDFDDIDDRRNVVELENIELEENIDDDDDYFDGITGILKYEYIKPYDDSQYTDKKFTQDLKDISILEDKKNEANQAAVEAENLKKKAVEAAEIAVYWKNQAVQTYIQWKADVLNIKSKELADHYVSYVVKNTTLVLEIFNSIATVAEKAKTANDFIKNYKTSDALAESMKAAVDDSDTLAESMKAAVDDSDTLAESMKAAVDDSDAAVAYAVIAVSVVEEAVKTTSSAKADAEAAREAARQVVQLEAAQLEAAQLEAAARQAEQEAADDAAQKAAEQKAADDAAQKAADDAAEQKAADDAAQKAAEQKAAEQKAADDAAQKAADDAAAEQKAADDAKIEISKIKNRALEIVAGSLEYVLLRKQEAEKEKEKIYPNVKFATTVAKTINDAFKKTLEKRNSILEKGKESLDEFVNKAKTAYESIYAFFDEITNKMIQAETAVADAKRSLQNIHEQSIQEEKTKAEYEITQEKSKLATAYRAYYEARAELLEYFTAIDAEKNSVFIIETQPKTAWTEQQTISPLSTDYTPQKSSFMTQGALDEESSQEQGTPRSNNTLIGGHIIKYNKYKYKNKYLKLKKKLLYNYIIIT